MSITALHVASRLPLPDYAQDALRYERHPQERTRAFHQFYGAPIATSRPDMRFSHMDDQRVAFRAAFIMSEAIEMLEKGLGLEVKLTVSAGGLMPDYEAKGSDNGELTSAIHNAMSNIGHDRRRNVVEVVDALGDLNVVVNGFALELGVNMRLVDQEVCASNFTKPDEQGRPIVSDGTDGHPKGKVLKGPNFVEPNIRSCIGI